MSVTLTDKLILGALATVFALGLASRFSLWQRMKFRGFAAWPTARATVQSCDYHESAQQRGPRFSAEVAYSYAIQGTYYSGYLKAYFFHERELDDFVSGHRVDSTFDIHVNPRNPEQSIVSIEFL